MLLPRLIPCLLIYNQGLVKTIKFGDPKYVGDPINAVKIFNEKKVDELMVLDIDATMKGRSPNYDLIAKLSRECRMPLTYGGGVSCADEIERIISLGVEKVAISAAAVSNPELISTAAARLGAQSVVVVADLKKTGLLRRYEVVTHRGSKRTGLIPENFIREVAARGAGEVVINFVDRDGTMEGYDVAMVQSLRLASNLPMTVLGGAGSHYDIANLWRINGLIGAAAGSLFVFKGKYRAVLINYPNEQEKIEILRQAGWTE